MKALLIAAAVLATTLPAISQTPNSGVQQEQLSHQMESSIRPMANPRYPTIYSSPRPVRAPWYED